VDAYIAAAGATPAAAHSAPDAAAAGSDGGGGGGGGGGDGGGRGRAAFLLDTALRSMAGRNFAAARARLTLCRAALLAQLGLGPEEHGGSGGASGGAASAGNCAGQGGGSESARALGRGEPGAGGGGGGGAVAAAAGAWTAVGRAAAGGGGEADSAGEPGAAGRGSEDGAGRGGGRAAAAGLKESARAPGPEGGAGGSADQLACQLGAVCGSLVRAQAACAGCVYMLHGCTVCRPAGQVCDREAHVRTLVRAETPPHCRTLLARPGTPVKAPHTPLTCWLCSATHTEASRCCRCPPLLAAPSALTLLSTNCADVRV